MVIFLPTPAAALLGLAITSLYFLTRRLRQHSIAHLPGPKSKSWLVGHVPAFQRAANAGEVDFKWSEEFGLAFRTKGCFGEDHLYIADPKALQHMLNKKGYHYAKTYELRGRQQLTTGRGIVWADGDQHARHRKIMNPAFSFSALKVFLPTFLEITQKTTTAWKATLQQRDQMSSVIDVSSWLTRTTLDIIGATAFGYNFNALEGEETELYKSYHNLFADINYMMSNFTIVFRRLVGFVPLWLSKYIRYLPKKDIRRIKLCDDLVRSIGRQLLAEQLEMHDRGERDKFVGKDVMSILIRANLAEDPRQRLGTDEVLSQIMTLTTAGHETTASTVAWMLYELSKRSKLQRTLRDEIKTTREKVIARGDQEMSIADLESMKLTMAVIKETLRFHPSVHQLFRMADQDDVIPLERPQRTVSGDMITSIPVSRGQIVILSIAVYNRLKSVWGEDADQWRPERFLKDLPNDHEHKINIGVVGNLATFSSGLRGCIGWRFAMLEMQVLLTELIENFEFNPAPGSVEIRRAMALLVQPMVKGRESEGTQMPLTVTVITNED